MNDQVAQYIKENPARLMSRAKFEEECVPYYNALVDWLINTYPEMEVADAQDFVSDYIVWGLEKDWDAWNVDQIERALATNSEPNTQFGQRDAQTRLRNFMRDSMAKGSNSELPILDGWNDGDDAKEVTEYGWADIFAENNPEQVAQELSGMQEGEVLLRITKSKGAKKSIHFEYITAYEREQELTERLSVITGQQRNVARCAADGMETQEQIAHIMGLQQPAIAKLIARALVRLYAEFGGEPLYPEWDKTPPVQFTERPNIHFDGFPFDQFELNHGSQVTRRRVNLDLDDYLMRGSMKARVDAEQRTQARKFHKDAGRDMPPYPFDEGTPQLDTHRWYPEYYTDGGRTGRWFPVMVDRVVREPGSTTEYIKEPTQASGYLAWWQSRNQLIPVNTGYKPMALGSSGAELAERKRQEQAEKRRKWMTS